MATDPSLPGLCQAAAAKADGVAAGISYLASRFVKVELGAFWDSEGASRHAEVLQRLRTSLNAAVLDVNDLASALRASGALAQRQLDAERAERARQERLAQEALRPPGS